MKCPICERPVQPYAPYCEACGADLKDPDVLALAGAGPVVTAPGAEASLASDRFLGVTAGGLESGRDLRRLAWVGGALLCAAFLVPLDPDWRGLRFAWALLGDGRSLGLLLPVLVGAAGIELAVLGGRVPHTARAATLFVLGAVVLALAIAPLAEGAGAPSAPPWLCWGGALLAAIGVAARILRPIDRNARWLVAAGGALVVIGLVVPHDDLRDGLPVEFPLYISDAALRHVSLLDASLRGLSHDFMVRFLSLWQLALPAAIAGAFALAWRRPSGPWDTKATGLRPLGWVVCLYLPLTFLLYAFNVAGWSTPGDYVFVAGRELDTDLMTRAMFAGRARFALITLGASAWIVGGAVALFLAKVKPALAAEPGAATPAP
jgi:hypothetical protein